LVSHHLLALCAPVDTHASMQSFKYTVCAWNSAMYPKPELTEAQLQHVHKRERDADPGYREDPKWFCCLCRQPVLDDRGLQRRARSFIVAADGSGPQKEPANWFHCDPCRKAGHDDKRALALKTSALGTPCIDKVLPGAAGMLW